MLRSLSVCLCVYVHISNLPSMEKNMYDDQTYRESASADD